MVTLSYAIKFELDFSPKYKWLDDNSCYNEKKVDVSNLDINIITCKYRIKPKPKYQPYKEVKEEWIGKKVIPFNENTSRINTITDIDLTMNEVAVYLHWRTMYNMFGNYIWGNNGDENDGKPFGELVK